MPGREGKASGVRLESALKILGGILQGLEQDIDRSREVYANGGMEAVCDAFLAVYLKRKPESSLRNYDGAQLLDEMSEHSGSAEYQDLFDSIVSKLKTRK